MGVMRSRGPHHPSQHIKNDAPVNPTAAPAISHVMTLSTLQPMNSGQKPPAFSKSLLASSGVVHGRPDPR
jgi:hypothetical protein